MIEPEGPLSLSRQCVLLGVSRSSHYYRPKGESAENLALMRRMDELHMDYPFYGSRQLMRHLRREGIAAGRHRIRRLMAVMGMEATYRRPRTSVANSEHRIFPLPVELHWPAEGSYLGTVLIPNQLELGWEGLERVTRMPLVRVRDLGDGRWSDPEPLLWLDISNRMHLISVPGDLPFVIAAQPFGDPDFVRFEPGAAVVMRSQGNPGMVELIEVDAGGDTTWHRRVELAPRRLTSAMVDEVVERWVAGLVSQGYKGPARLRQAYYDGVYRPLYQPEYVPPAVGPPVLTASREVWIKTPELLDTLRVYYTVPRGDSTGLPRRVLVPESLWVTDATETHVWGVERDSIGLPHIIGRRLVPPPA